MVRPHALRDAAAAAGGAVGQIDPGAAVVDLHLVLHVRHVVAVQPAPVLQVQRTDGLARVERRALHPVEVVQGRRRRRR